MFNKRYWRQISDNQNKGLGSIRKINNLSPSLCEDIMILVKKPKLDYDQEENDNLRKEEDEWEWYWNCKSSLNQKKSPHGSWVASFSPSDWVRCRRRSKIGGLVGTEPARWRNKPTSCEATWVNEFCLNKWTGRVPDIANICKKWPKFVEHPKTKAWNLPSGC